YLINHSFSILLNYIIVFKFSYRYLINHSFMFKFSYRIFVSTFIFDLHVLLFPIFHDFLQTFLNFTSFSKLFFLNAVLNILQWRPLFFRSMIVFFFFFAIHGKMLPCLNLLILAASVYFTISTFIPYSGFCMSITLFIFNFHFYYNIL
ncbi:hypothetical protein L9F63_013424, partial [Diploptera punctata]